ncbi:hypothetical protein D0T90_02425 [Neisseria animalis]|uniref:Uncharacterized protein n=1 Tax=Neisseria animalis TaxID=492 RepID=A0A5P3MPP0_NEIAN|nr:hypothetical protein D0T90_02425 [Neisseria animalis]ROW33341.1 hypothetical protein CGZ60_01175 [Neisseria animalis]
MPCRTMCTVCGFATLSHSYFIRLYQSLAVTAQAQQHRIMLTLNSREQNKETKPRHNGIKAVCKINITPIRQQNI